MVYIMGQGCNGFWRCALSSPVPLSDALYAKKRRTDAQTFRKRRGSGAGGASDRGRGRTAADRRAARREGASGQGRTAADSGARRRAAQGGAERRRGQLPALGAAPEASQPPDRAEPGRSRAPPRSARLFFGSPVTPVAPPEATTISRRPARKPRALGANEPTAKREAVRSGARAKPSERTARAAVRPNCARDVAIRNPGSPVTPVAP